MLESSQNKGCKIADKMKLFGVSSSSKVLWAYSIEKQSRYCGSHHWLHLCELWPSRTPILLSGSHRHAPRVTRAQQQRADSRHPCRVNKVSTLFSATQTPNRCKVHKQADRYRNSHWLANIRSLAFSFSFSLICPTHVFWAWTTAVPCSYILCALVFHISFFYFF